MFEAKLNLEIKKISDDGVEVLTNFFNTDVNWHNLSYDGVVALESVLVEALNKMNDLGVSQCEDEKVVEFIKNKNRK